MPTLIPARYITPVPKRSATGQVAAVYAQLATDLGRVAEAYTILSPAPAVMAATWALLRESQLVGQAPRTDKELVATAVSHANRCPFCVDAHTFLTHATGAHQLAETVWRGDTPADPAHARLVAWAAATRTPGAPELAAPPFPPAHAAEYIGTALGFHFINRMVSALLPDSPLPGRLRHWRMLRRLGGRLFTRSIQRTRRPGDSLHLLEPDRPPATADEAPAWAGDTPIGTAMVALRAATTTGGTLLSDPARDLLRRTVAAWDGHHPPVTLDWLTQPLATLPEADRPAARLALLAALAPYRITDTDVTAWHATHPSASDADLVRLLAFGAIITVNHLETAITGVQKSAPRELDQTPASRRPSSRPTNRRHLVRGRTARRDPTNGRHPRPAGRTHSRE